MLRRQLCVLLASALLFAACGGDDGGSPTAPTAPTPAPNYQGVWSGTHSITSCQETGQFAGFCSQFTIGAQLPLRLTVAVTPAGAVTGTLELGSFFLNTTGVVGGNNHLLMSGSGNGVGFSLTLTNWDTNATGSTMTGTFTISYTHPQFTGTGVTVHSTGTLTKTA